MPSGHTAALYDGEQSLRDYLMGIGRGMGFAITQRDDAPGPVKLPKRDDTYARWLAEARDALAATEALTDEQALAKARAEHDETERSHAEQRAKRDAIRRRYEAMVEAVEAWKPDPLIAATNTKQFALEQLRQSIDFDCREFGFLAPREFPEKTGAQWRQEFIDAARARVERYGKEAADEAQRNEDREAHIRAFLESLPPDSSASTGTEEQ